MSQNRATLEELREFCNKVRNAGGANPLDALFNAVPEEPTECLIARNLNFSCVVDGVARGTWPDVEVEAQNADKDGPWCMHVEDQELAEKISNATGCPWQVYDEAESHGYGKNYIILLPGPIGQVASDFDRTWSSLYGSIPFLSDEELAEDGIDLELLSLVEEFNKNHLAEDIISELEYGARVEDINPNIRAIVEENLQELGIKDIEKDQAEDRELAPA